MDVSIDFDGHDPDEIADMFRDFEGALEDELEDAAVDIGARIEGAAKRNIQSQNAVDQGRLLNGIEFDIQQIGRSVIRVMVGTNVDHGEIVEKGADPFFPPSDALEGWSGRVLGDEDAAFPVARSISETGIDPRPFLRAAFEENEEYAIDRVQEAIMNARDEAFG